VSTRRAFIWFISANSDVSGARSTLIRRAHSWKVHAFVTSRVDYCNAVLAAAPKTTTDRLQRVLNAAARVISDTRKFDHGLSRLMHQELHWLDIPERVSYKLGMMPHRCLLARQSASVPVQLLHPGRPSRNTSASAVCCTSSADRSATSSQHLRSSGIRWSDDIQHSAKWSARPLCQHSNLRTIV